MAVVTLLSLPCFAKAHSQKTYTASAGDSSKVLEHAKELAARADPQAALSLMEHADIRGSERADYHALKGLCLAMLDKPIESIPEFEQAIALKPKYAPYFFSYGLALASFNDLQEAAGEFVAALRLDPQLPGVRYNYATVLEREGKYKESEEEVDQELLSKQPRSESMLQLWMLKAHDAYARKDWGGTIVAYQHVIDLQPNDAEAYAGLGEALFTLNRIEESRTSLQKAVTLDDSDAHSYEILGKIYQQIGNQKEAITAFEASDRSQLGNREVIYRLFRIYKSKGDVSNSARLQKELEDTVASNLTQSTNDAEAASLNSDAMELEKNGKFAAALEEYERAAAVDVTNIVFSRNAALLLCKMGRTQEAIERLRDILAANPDDAETAQILAVAKEIASGGSSHVSRLPLSQPAKL